VNSNVFWTCRSCGANVSGELLECPHCVRPTPPQPQRKVSAVEVDSYTGVPAWVRGVSIPGALFGMLVFFLPWVAVSCGPVRMTVSGYEFATGKWSEKFSDRNIDSFFDRTNRQLNQQSGLRQRLPARQLPPGAKVPSGPQASEAQNDPLLWIVPGACLILLVLGIAGLPRAPTILVCSLGAAYLAYFGVTSEQQLNDPRVTGGILGHEWLFGYWGSWVGLMAPMFVAIFRPRHR